MKLIIGLGNPGDKYKRTRHNVGFHLINIIQEKFEFPNFSFEKKFKAKISEKKIGKEKILLVKPQTLMNKSGESVSSLLDFYKLSPSQIIVAHDDLDIAIGTFKIAGNSSSAGHNGIQNIIDLLGTKEFQRIRIGIGDKSTNSPQCKMGAHDFVLGRFSKEETEKLEKATPEILAFIEREIAN